MDRIEVTARPREVSGKKVRFLRRQGITPANLSGLGEASQALQVDARELSVLINRRGRNTLVNLRVDGGAPIMALLNDYSVHPIKNTLVHVDFQRVSAGQTLTVDLSLNYIGESPVDNRADLLLLRILNTVRVECVPTDLPSHLDVDLATLAELDDAIAVKDLTVPSGVTVLNDPDEVIARVAMVQAVPEEAEEAEAAAEEEAAEGEEARAEAEGEQPSAEAGEAGEASEEENS